MPASRILKIAKKPAKFQSAISMCQFLSPGTTLYLDIFSKEVVYLLTQVLNATLNEHEDSQSAATTTLPGLGSDDVHARRARDDVSRDTRASNRSWVTAPALSLLSLKRRVAPPLCPVPQTCQI